MNLTLTIVFEKDDGAVHAYIPEIPGVYSCGATIDEARVMVLDALREVVGSRNELPPENPSDLLLTESLTLRAALNEKVA